MNLAAKLTNGFAESLLEFIYPPLCISCDRSLSDGHEKVCDLCWGSIQRLTRNHPLFLDTKNKLLEAGFLSDLASTFVFEKQGAFQHIAHYLKYKGYESLGIQLGMRLGEKMLEWQVAADMLIPVPLHKVKLRERGYNQAEMIAQGISAVTNIAMKNNLVHRRRHTQTQTRLNLEQRKQNMEDAFGVTERDLAEVRDKVCVIVDDVITTGATISSCAEVLLNCGASKVIAASAALAQKGAA